LFRLEEGSNHVGPEIHGSLDWGGEIVIQCRSGLGRTVTDVVLDEYLIGKSFRRLECTLPGNGLR
jgi:hypothetical protein